LKKCPECNARLPFYPSENKYKCWKCGYEEKDTEYEKGIKGR
jgi:DNA-directed RNA polymerase subunit M/transcription elongation factor TFIIS